MSRHGDALKRYRDAADADAPNRDATLEDFRWYASEQWEQQVEQQRRAAGKPTLTMNRLPMFVRQVINEVRLKPPAVKVRPGDSRATPDLAEIFTGLIRNVEQQSQAEIAYTRALEHAAIGGMGHFRIQTEYADDDTFDQDVRVRPVMSPLAVTWDHDARHPLRTDAQFTFVTDIYSKEAFEERWPDATPASWDSFTRDYPDWMHADFVRIAEYWYRKPVTKTLLRVDGVGVVDADKLTEEDIGRAREMGLITGERRVETTKICQVLMSGHEELSDVTEWPGRWFPIVPVLGDEVDVGERVVRRGMVRDARPAQMIYNIHRTALAEAFAMAPKAKWQATPKQIEGFHSLYEAANVSNVAVLPYNVDPAAPGKPERVMPEVPSQALIADLQLAAADLEAVIGMHRAALGAESNETSGRALRMKRAEGDVGTFHYVDNLNRAVEHCGRILVDLLPRIYDTERQVRVLGESGEDKFVWINVVGPNGERIHDLSAGKYDVVVEAGPSFATRREEARESMLAFMQSMPQQAAMIADLYVEANDWPGADEVAKRLRRPLVAQGIAEPREGDEPQQQQQGADAAAMIGQAEMMKAQVQQQRAQIEGMVKMAELELKRAEIALKAGELELKGVRVNVQNDVDRARIALDAAKNLQASIQPLA